MSGKGGAPNPYVIAIIVTLAAFMEVTDTTIVNVSLPYIAGDLGVSTDNAAWSLTTYLVANGITLTVSASLSKQLGRQKYFLISIIGFTVTSLLCGLSTNFGELLLFRGLQGLFGGGLQPMQQAIVLDTFPPDKRQQALSITAVATIIAPVIGPLVGGYLTFNYSWHWIFLVNVPIGVGTVIGVLAFVKDPPEMAKAVRRAPPFDWTGAVFITLALGCMELGADRGEDYDWLASNFIRLMLVLSVIAYVGGVTYLLYTKNPAVNLRVFRDRNFALSWFGMAMMGFALYASAIIMPIFSQNVLGLQLGIGRMGAGAGRAGAVHDDPDRQSGAERGSCEVGDPVRRPGVSRILLLFDGSGARSRFLPRGPSTARRRRPHSACCSCRSAPAPTPPYRQS